MTKERASFYPECGAPSDKRKRPRLVLEIHSHPAQFQHGRKFFEQRKLEPRIELVGLGQNVGGGTLKHVELAGEWSNRRNDLDGARAGSDGGEPLAGQIASVRPVGRMKRGAGKIFQARQLWD